MTDISVSDDAATQRSRLGRLLPMLLPVIALAAGVGVGMTGLWSPLSLMRGGHKAEPTLAAAPAVTFLDVPRIVLTVPGERSQTLAMTVMVEVDPAAMDRARTLLPRITDSYNQFLSRIDPTAFGRRGILEIVRAELATRTRFILGDTAVRDLLITEFRIQ